MSIHIDSTNQAVSDFQSGTISIRRLQYEHADEIGHKVSVKLIAFEVSKEFEKTDGIFSLFRRGRYIATPEGFIEYKKTHRRKDGNTKPKVFRVYNS